MKPEQMQSVLVIVIDDQLDPSGKTDDRSAIYATWLAHVSDFHVGKWTFDIHYCASLSDVARITLEPGRPCLAIVDMVLVEGTWTTGSVAQLDDKLIGEKWPLILVSAKFDETQAIQRANRLVGKASDAAPFQFLTWASICRAIDGFDANEVAFIVGATLARAHAQDLWFRKRLDESIELVHVTDPHFGKAHWDVGSLMYLRAARERIGLKTADFLVISGDIADRGTPAQYELASDYFEALADNAIVGGTALGLAKDRVFLCPGNHDFSRTIALGANMASAPPYEIGKQLNVDNEWVRAYAWAPYEKFDHVMTGRPGNWLARPGFRIDRRFASAGLIFLELNVERYGIDGFQEGFSTAHLSRTINAAVAQVAAIRSNAECLIVVAHRNESDMWQGLAQTIQTSLSGLATQGPLIFMCGHEHSADVSTNSKNRVLFIRGVPPSDGPVLPNLVLPMISSIELRRANGRVAGVTVNQFKQDASGWVLDVDGPRKYDYGSGIWRASA